MACISLPTLSYHVWNLAAPNIRSFGIRLSPVHHRCQISRRVSYYALFKWWLLLSQHPRCHRNLTPLSTQSYFGTLAGDLGCFPFDHEGYPSQSDSRDSPHGIRSLVEGGSRVGPTFHPVALPPSRNFSRLAQERFRREPDIPAFD